MPTSNRKESEVQGQTKAKKTTTVRTAASVDATQLRADKREIAAQSTADALLTIEQFMRAAWGDAAQRLVA